MIIQTLSVDFTLASTDVTDANAYASKIPTNTAPAVGALDFGPGASPNGILVSFLGRIAAGGDASGGSVAGIRIIGWRRVAGSAVASTATGDAWIPLILFETGVVGMGNVTVSISGTTYYIADAISIDADFATSQNVSFEVVAPGTDLPAYVAVDTRGCQKVEINYGDMTTIDRMNALVARM